MSGAFRIASPVQAEGHLGQLQAWLKAEWGAVRLIDANTNEAPKPIVGVTADDVLAGGLAFSRAPSPVSDEPATWVNAVFVAPAYRGRGLASQLIRAAEDAARELRLSRLFALTELPDLYVKLGWLGVNSEDGDYVMMKEIHL